MHRLTFLLSVCLAGCAAGIAAQEAAGQQLNARDLFFSADPNAATGGAAKTGAGAGKAGSAGNAANGSGKGGAQPATVGGVKGPVAVSTGAVVLTASARGAHTDPLGLRYSVMKLSGDDMVQVPSDQVFHAGDKIQLNVQTNGPGYLYVVSQGASGSWQPVFPSLDVDSGNNHVDGWRSYALPPKSRMVFDQQTGVEKIFVVFSREPENDLEKLIYSLPGAKPGTEPAKAPAGQEPFKVMYAGLNIDDATVGRLRNIYARDLVVEQVDEASPVNPSSAALRETAVYVVNPKGAPDSRVVADIELVHQ